MVQESAFRGIIGFLDKIGVYDVILPFLLVFTIVFAILEKTKVLGLDKIDGKEFTKKNLNSMVAFVISFLVIASTQLVSVINEVLANVVLLLILAVCFLMLVGVFFGDQEFTLKDFPGWSKFLMILMFIGIVVIFLNALDWLKYILVIFVYWDAEWASTIIFFIIILGFIVYIIRDPNTNKSSEKKD
ncbi:hypothetical protein HOA91_01245 [Candidatus Woesearchaeota archaeon]|jgi:hypothetical protein|nr:hypothetical protein [Candidatus Woesearchaeota archaeon]